jgi:hypothetical protein
VLFAEKRLIGRLCGATDFLNLVIFVDGISVQRVESERDDAGQQHPVLVVVGGGAAGIFGALQAKTVFPQMQVRVLEKGKLLSKVWISSFKILCV